MVRRMGKTERRMRRKRADLLEKLALEVVEKPGFWFIMGIAAINSLPVILIFVLLTVWSNGNFFSIAVCAS